MILVFVDETGDVKFKRYFGLSVAVVKHNFYRQIKEEFHAILHKHGWNPSIEFKGSYLFSATSGDTNISIDERIAIATEVLQLTASEANSRMKLFYLKHETDDPKADYLRTLPLLLEKALPRATDKRQGKDLLSLSYDRRDDMTPVEVRSTVLPTIEKRGYTLVEDVCMATSNYNTVGILFADIVGYLVARIDTISNDAELFENLTPEHMAQNGKLRKLQASKSLLENVRSLKRGQLVVKHKIIKK